MRTSCDWSILWASRTGTRITRGPWEDSDRLPGLAASSRGGAREGSVPPGLRAELREALDVLGDELPVLRIVELRVDQPLGGADGEVGDLAAQRVDRLLLLELHLALPLLDQVERLL